MQNENYIKLPKNIDNIIYDNTMELFGIINNFLEDYDYETATELLTREIEKNPKSLNIRKKRIEVMMAQHNDYTHYSNSSEIAYSIDLPTKNINYNYILQDCSEILKENKEEYYYSIRAEIFNWCNYKYEAINDLKECIKFNKTNIKYYKELAELYKETNEYQLSINVYTYIINNYKNMQNLGYFDNLEKFYSNIYFLHKEIGNEDLAFKDLQQLNSLKDAIYDDYLSNCFIQSCYILKKYNVAYEYITKNKIKTDYFLVPYIYKKMNNYKKEKEFYLFLIKRDYTLIYNSSLVNDEIEYLRNYKRLIILEHNLIKRSFYFLLYYFNKNILYYIKKFLYIIDDKFINPYRDCIID